MGVDVDVDVQYIGVVCGFEGLSGTAPSAGFLPY